jgi:hypothetical protein
VGVDYADIQFTKAPHILRGMGMGLGKSEKVQRELAEKGMTAPGIWMGNTGSRRKDPIARSHTRRSFGRERCRVAPVGPDGL